MPLKSRKKKPEAEKTNPGSGETTWEAKLIEAQLEEDSWRACVSMVVGRSPAEEALIQALALAVPQRQLFTSITRDNTLAKVSETKGKKSVEPPMFYEVMEAAKAMSDAGHEVSCDLMAKILKVLLLQIKNDDQRKVLAEQEDKVKTSQSSAKNKGRDKGSHEKVVSSPADPSKERTTKLKRRGYVDPPTFKDDEPDDGPQHYILLLGFYQPHLIEQLDAIGVHIANIIQLCSEQTLSCEEQPDYDDNEQKQPDESSQLVVQAKNLDRFWSGLKALLDGGPLNSKLHDVAQLRYTVSDVSPPFLTQDPEAMLELGSSVFDGVANLIYECLRWRRQHRHYQEHIKLIKVPSAVGMDSRPSEAVPTSTPYVEEKSVLEGDLSGNEVDTRHYNSLLDLVPPEACSVPLILNSMLEQVVVSTEQSHTAEEPKPLDSTGLDQQLVDYIIPNFSPLLHGEEEKRKFATGMQSLARTKEDKKVVPAEVDESMMRFSPVSEMIQSFQQRSSRSIRLALKQQLQHYCSDDELPWPQVERFLHQSVFEAMPLTLLDQHDVIPEAVRALGDSHETDLTFAKTISGPTFLTEDTADAEQSSGRVCPQLDLCDLQRPRLRSLSEWHYAEHFDASIVPQVLQVASEQYLCMDTFRGSHNDTLYIFCHNPMNPHRQCKESWDIALHTDVNFRTYLEHVADTISDWTREEELKQDVMQIKNSTESPEVLDLGEHAVEDVLEVVIRKGSLKEWKLEQDRLKEEEMSKKENRPKGKSQREEGGPASNKKGKPSSEDRESLPQTVAAGGKAPQEPVVSTAAPLDGNMEDGPLNGFTGYGMDGQLIHVSGRLHHIFPSDGGRITMENINFVDGSRLIKVAVMADGHSFFTHINWVKPPPQPQVRQKADHQVSDAMETIRVKQGSLNAVLENGIRLSYSFYGPNGECTVTTQETEKGITTSSIPSSPTTDHSKEADIQTSPGNTTPLQMQVTEDQPASPATPFRSLNLSVPNGLVLNFLLDDIHGISPEEKGILVRQSFPLHSAGDLSHHQDLSLSKELFRIITGQGAVIRYLKDGSTEVLFADGTVSFRQDSGPVGASDSEVQEENSHVEAKGEKEWSSQRDAETPRGCWLTTTPSGSRICTVGTTDENKSTRPLLSFEATDFFTRQVMVTREDHMVLVQNPDGGLIVQHVDGTRITSVQQDSDHGGMPVKEQVVTVEKEGCATVVMYPERHTARVLLADGSVVTGSNRGEYQVFPSKAGLLHIQNDGKCVYSSGQRANSSSSTGTPTSQAGIYTMSHADDVACEVTDLDDNHFQITEDGQVYELNFNPSPSSGHDEGELKEEEDREFYRQDLPNLPRLFLVHKDGSGTELLNSRVVQKLLDQAYADPTIALLKEPLPDSQGDFGITLLKPSHRSVWSQWLCAKQIPDITPPNLRNRSWHDFPRVEKKTSGPPFGIDLSLWGKCDGSAAQPQAVRSCPDVLEIRELSQHRPFTRQIRNTLDSRLKNYFYNLMEREERYEQMQIKDPRTEEESTFARDLLSRSLANTLMQSFAEEDVVSHSSLKSSATADMASLYRRGLGTRTEQPDDSENPAGSQEGVACLTKSKDPKWTERLAKHRQELQEEKTYREAVKRKDILPYFHPENKQLHQSLQHHQFPNMKILSMEQPLIYKSDSAESFLEDASQESTPWRLNPTPSQSTSHSGTKGRMSEKRPTNPTPQSDGESSQKRSGRQCNPLHVDVTGKPRKTKVRLPTSILSSKPKCLPNEQFLTVEEPVRRRCRTVSLTDPAAIVRGFQLFPASVDFGMVPDATSTAITVVMRNVGVDTCRFRVQQPPLATGLRVIYNSGPVAAGLHVELQVQLLAMHAAKVENISHDIVINTETEILYLPVTATILPKMPYDIWKKKNTRAQRK